MFHQNKHIKEEIFPEHLQECIITWRSLSGRFQNILQLTLSISLDVCFYIFPLLSFMIIEVKSSDYTIQQVFDASCLSIRTFVRFLFNCPREISGFCPFCRITYQKHSSEICHFQRNLNTNVRRGVEKKWSSCRESALYTFLLSSQRCCFILIRDSTLSFYLLHLQPFTARVCMKPYTFFRDGIKIFSVLVM